MIDDDNLTAITVIGIALIGMPIWLVNRAWGWLRTGTFRRHP